MYHCNYSELARDVALLENFVSQLLARIGASSGTEILSLLILLLHRDSFQEASSRRERGGMKVYRGIFPLFDPCGRRGT
jgi:hypothetical protein